MCGTGLLDMAGACLAIVWNYPVNIFRSLRYFGLIRVIPVKAGCQFLLSLYPSSLLMDKKKSKDE